MLLTALPQPVDSILMYLPVCFAFILGHLIFEMCAGYELTKAHPDPADLYNCRNSSVVEVGIVWIL